MTFIPDSICCSGDPIPHIDPVVLLYWWPCVILTCWLILTEPLTFVVTIWYIQFDPNCYSIDVDHSGINWKVLLLTVLWWWPSPISTIWFKIWWWWWCWYYSIVLVVITSFVGIIWWYLLRDYDGATGDGNLCWGVDHIPRFEIWCYLLLCCDAILRRWYSILPDLFWPLLLPGPVTRLMRWQFDEFPVAFDWPRCCSIVDSLLTYGGDDERRWRWSRDVTVMLRFVGPIPDPYVTWLFWLFLPDYSFDYLIVVDCC